MNEELDRDGLGFVITLQDVVQPAGVPVLPLLDLAGRCWVSPDALEPGGSWFDVVLLPEDRLALVVGEAPGVGLTSAITAAQMRAVIGAGLRRDGDISTALQLADTHAEDLTDARGTTAAVVLFDPIAGTASYACAGHRPPLLLPTLGSPEFLGDTTGGGPLGTGTGGGYPAGVCLLSGGDGILLAGSAAYRSRPGPTGVTGADWSNVTFEGLHSAAYSPAQPMASKDTLCVVAARLRRSRHRALELTLEGEADTARLARDELGAWLTELGASPVDQMALTHAAAELVTNAVEHGGKDTDRRIEVTARLGSDGCVEVEVTDRDTWKEPAGDSGSGRGLGMAAGLVDHLRVSVGASGTRVLLRHRLVRPVPIEVAGHASDPTVASVLEVVHTAPRTVALRGIFDHDDVERISAEILVVTRGGTIPLSLDLTGVTHLSTSAVRLLADLTSTIRAVGMDTAAISIVSATDSVIERTLATARVPHHAS